MKAISVPLVRVGNSRGIRLPAKLIARHKLHPAWRTRPRMICAGKAAEVCGHQIRVIARSRLGRKIASLSARDALALRLLVNEMYGES